MPVSRTVQQFRENVIARGGPQIAAKYKVSLYAPGGYLVCYPLSVILPGRNFSFYEHDIWGPTRRVPYKRGYTQCNMTFIVYQDWAERKFMEAWMNYLVSNKAGTGNRSNNVSTLDGEMDIQQGQTSTGLDDEIAGFIGLYNNAGELNTDTLNRLVNYSSNIKDSQSKSAISDSNYNDWANYNNTRFKGRVVIECLNAQDQNASNFSLELKEAYPAQISPLALGSDGTGYPSFTATFQYNSYFLV